MPKTITSGMNTHLDLTVTTLATMWQVTRVDGTEFFFTDHDVNLSFEGNLYKAATGFNRSAISNNATLGVDNLDIESIFDSADILEVDLRGGKFDFAEVRIFIVNWSNLADGKITMRRGWLGEVVMNELGFFRTELRGMTQVLSQSIGNLYQVECRVDLTDAKCGIPILPDLVLRDTAYRAADSQGPADFVRVNTAGLTNPIVFTLGTNKGLDSLTGWTTNEGTPDIQSTTPSPQEGSGYVGSSATDTYEIEQIIAIDTDLAAAKIDARDYTMDVSAWYAQDAADTNDTGQMIVQFLNASDGLISVAFDTGILDPATSNTFFKAFKDGITIPALTRKIKVILRGDEVGALSTTQFYWDNFFAQFHDVAGLALEGHEIYENRVYECTIAGTTASTQPTYDTVIGNTTVDGTATFTARDAFMRDATVNVVTDQETFTIDNFTEARAVDDWFNGGAITWETGNNIGLTMEIRDWTSGSATVKLFLPMPFTIVSGDKIRLYAGCDKRLATCRDKFNNVINFRGEPHIPGVDALLGTIN